MDLRPSKPARTGRAAAPSPVVDLNRAIAHGMAFGPEAGLRLLDPLREAPALRTYAPLPSHWWRLCRGLWKFAVPKKKTGSRWY